MVPNTIDEQIEHDGQIAAEIVELTENDNNNLPKLPMKSENSYRVTPSGLIMEENKSPPRNKKKIYMIVPSSEPLQRISDIVHESESQCFPLGPPGIKNFVGEIREDNWREESKKEVAHSLTKNNQQNSPVPTPDQNSKPYDHETSKNDRLYSILDFPISKL